MCLSLICICSLACARNSTREHFSATPPTRRNLTIQGAPGTWPTLDLNFAYEILEVCATCIVHLKGNLTIANDRRGTNPTYDFVVGKVRADDAQHSLRCLLANRNFSVNDRQRMTSSRNPIAWILHNRLRNVINSGCLPVTLLLQAEPALCSARGLESCD